MIDETSEFFGAWIIAAFTWFFGGMDGVVKVLIAFAVIDYVSGICAAGFEGKISSKTGLKGIAKKIIMFCFVGIAHIIDANLIGTSDAFREIVCLFYIGNEGMSIIENAIRLGVPFPKVLRDRFEQFSRDDDKALKGGETDGHQ